MTAIIPGVISLPVTALRYLRIVSFQQRQRPERKLHILKYKVIQYWGADQSPPPQK